ncbi:MAG: hypothetical protein H0U36_04610, partial [Nocardioidaceae bacterium]|nr:hypothetical protein [Nocardioidaceae bacterium]
MAAAVLRRQDHRRLDSAHPTVIATSVHQRVLEISANTTYDVPLAALRAYRRSAAEVASSCHLSWGVVAAIGQ